MRKASSEPLHAPQGIAKAVKRKQGQTLFNACGADRMQAERETNTLARASDVVTEVWPEQPFGLCNRQAPAPGIVLDLISTDQPYFEVARLGMREVPSTDRGSRQHRPGFGQLHADAPPDAEQFPEFLFFTVFRTSRIARGGGECPGTILRSDRHGPAIPLVHNPRILGGPEDADTPRMPRPAGPPVPAA